MLNIGYYLRNNKDIRLSGEDPILHYIYHGFNEGRRPSAKFDANYYIERYEDVKKSNLNPLIHYSLYGINEGRKIIPPKSPKTLTPLKSSTHLKTLNNEIKTPSKINKTTNSLKESIIQFTPAKTTNPYYTMIGDELISRGYSFKYINNFQSIEELLKQEKECIVHLHQPEPYYHSNNNEEETLEKANKFLDELTNLKKPWCQIDMDHAQSRCK